MRTLLFTLIFSFPIYLAGQTGTRDSITTILQIDSLLSAAENTWLTKRDFNGAREINAAAVAIAVERFGFESAAHGLCYSNLGRIYYGRKQYAECEKAYLEGQRILEKAAGKSHPFYARNLTGLGMYYRGTGNYEKAELVYLEAKAILERTVEKTDPAYTTLLNRLANIYTSLGVYDKAARYQLEAIALLKGRPGEARASYALSLNNLADVYMAEGRYAEVEPLLLEANAIQLEVLGKQHTFYALNLGNLADLYTILGRYEEARTLYLEAIAIRARANQQNSPNYAMLLWSLGRLDVRTGQIGNAHSLFLEAQAIFESIVGQENPAYCQIGMDLAELHELQRHPAESEAQLNSMFARQRAELAKSTCFLSEQELGCYTASFRQNGDKLAAFLLARHTRGDQPGTLPGLTFDYALLHKGFLLTAAARMRRLTANSPEAQAQVNQLQQYRRQLAAQYARPAANRTDVAELQEQALAVEKQLARRTAGPADGGRQVTWPDVQAALRPGEAAVEFIHFQQLFPRLVDTVRYAALVLRPGARQPVFVPLADEKTFEALLATSGTRRAEYVDRVYNCSRSLYNALWSALEPALAGVKTVYVAPTGLLHRVNFEAMATPQGGILADRYHFVRLGSTRQLVGNPTVPTPAPFTHGALLLGGIRYEVEGDATTTSRTASLQERAGHRGDQGLPAADSLGRMRGGAWAYLPSTEKEVGSIAAVLAGAGLTPTVRTGFAATEEVVKAIGQGQSSPRILHLATHGYFFPDPKTTVGQYAPGGANGPVFKCSDHPMIRSGLLLAGANYTWQTGRPYRPDAEDGVLTAYEISQLDLSNTELVVLSACETGLGDIQGNEGVYGLQRAFKIAGAKYLIMSLWQVPDVHTQELMTLFYKKWLREKMAIPEAFRAAQAVMRAKYEHAYWWAGFVLVE